MAITRRALMRNGAMALAGTTMVPGFLARAVFAAETSDARAKQRVVVLFQRGAADGLNIVVPHAESYYYQARSSIAIPRDRVLDLDGFFGLHPALAPFKPLWDQKQLAIVHAAGSTDPSRSIIPRRIQTSAARSRPRVQRCTKASKRFPSRDGSNPRTKRAGDSPMTARAARTDAITACTLPNASAEATNPATSRSSALSYGRTSSMGSVADAG